MVILLTEDLFLSSTTVPDGQNYAMMMFVDFSGSMGRHIGTIEQTLIQVAFCKKVVSHLMYGFSNCADSLQSEKFGNASRGSAFNLLMMVSCLLSLVGSLCFS